MYKSSLLNVINNEFCIGCGVCASQTDEIDMVLNHKGYYQASINEEINGPKLEMVSKICPFSSESKNEDDIGEHFFGGNKHTSEYLGRYNECYIGYVSEGDARSKGSSGGLGKWMAHELFRLGYVDKVIQVKLNERMNTNDPLYSFTICDDAKSIKNGSKSAYYPVEMSGVLKYIKENPAKYLITGVPCFIKSIRLLQLEEEIYKTRIKFTIGLVCGHLKSENYANMIGWQLGVHPNDIKSLDFRKKIEGSTAKEKGVEVKSIKNPSFSKDDIVQNLFGTNYGAGFFKMKACDYCDDVVSETADATVGDAWLPNYVNDGRGNNVLIVRNPILSGIIEDAKANNRLALKDTSEEDIIKSQDAGFRHRREGLAYRLYLADKDHQWRPIKRVKPSSKSLNRNAKRIQKVRIHLRDQSHIQFDIARKNGDFEYFRKVMAKELKKLRAPIWKRIGIKIKNKLKKL